MKKWLVRILGGLVSVIVVVLGVVYVQSSRVIGRHYTFREVPITLPTDSAALARGAHLVALSCRGCHSDSLQGGVMFDAPLIARVVAPAVLVKIRGYTDAELAGYLRYGVRKDGTSTVIMPPRGFYHLSDSDLGAIIAYLRTLPPPGATAAGTNSYGPLGRFGLMVGQFKMANGYIDTTVARVGADASWSTTRLGEYLARVICSDCHTAKLTGDSAGPSPSVSLAAAAGYSREELVTLLRTGKPRDPARKLTMMAEVYTTIQHLTDEELTALHGYLAQLPLTGVPGVR